MDSNLTIIKFLFQNEWDLLANALKVSPIYETESFLTANDLASFLSSLDAGLIICAVQNKEDLLQIATLIKLQRKLAKDALVKMVVINFSGQRQFETALVKLGIQEIIDPSINVKGLRFKIDFWM